MLKFLFLLVVTGCTTFEKTNEVITKADLKSTELVISKNIKLDCAQNQKCLEWKTWLTEVIKKSPKHKIPKSFYLEADQKYFRAKNLSQFLDNLGEVVISYADYHCLENQLSCTFDGEKKIFFNLKALELSKVDWLRVFWHEVFHLNYPEVTHINCSACGDQNSRTFVECDKNSFSSYGLEYLWLKTHAFKYSTDKKFNRHKKQMLKDLSNRICRKKF